MARYAVSDLHGRKDIFDKIMSELIGPNDTLYILGDVVDRGPEPFELLRAAMSDPRVKLLKGNHEDMFKNAIYEYTDEW
jgi:serine/threonine protein phosphatase 1